MKGGIENTAAVVMVSFLLAGLAEPQPQDQVFRARVARIEVDVRVTDDGGFVADLSADEFSVYEDEEPVEVLGVQLVDLAAGRPVEGSSGDRVGVEDLGAGENARRTIRWGEGGRRVGDGRSPTRHSQRGALSHLGAAHIEIPIRPDRVWEILKEKGVAE